MMLIGAGPAATRFVLANPAKLASPTPLAYFTTQDHDANPGNHLADCTFARFEIDGSGVILPGYDVYAKGLFLQYVLRGHFHDLYIGGQPVRHLGLGRRWPRRHRLHDDGQPSGRL